MSRRVRAPRGAALLPGLKFAGMPVARERGGQRRVLVHHDELGWQLAAIVLDSDGRTLVVACPLCPAPKLRKRKRPRPMADVVATHRHGHVDDSPVQHRAPHCPTPHRGQYIIVDPFGHLARSGR